MLPTDLSTEQRDAWKAFVQEEIAEGIRKHEEERFEKFKEMTGLDLAQPQLTQA